MTAEQLEEARAERMRQNGHGAIVIEDVRTWIEETGLCIFLPRSVQAGQPVSPAPTFIEAVAGQRTPEPTLELIASAESLLVRLEAEGVAVRLNLSGLPGDQPDYVVAGWVLPYIYALRGDRDWRRSPQLTGSRQVSQLAVLAAKQIDSANMTAAEIRDALGREVTETAVLRALHELWKQLRIIPVVPAVGSPALWQPLRQRFQKAIAEGASTSQVTAISVLASIYLQAVIAASMEDVEMFLSPLTSRSKIREVVRGLAATRQVHSTTMGHSPMFYVAGTLPEFPAVPSFQISAAMPAYRSSNYRGSTSLASYLEQAQDEAVAESRSFARAAQVERDLAAVNLAAASVEPTVPAAAFAPEGLTAPQPHSNTVIRISETFQISEVAQPSQAKARTPKPAPQRPRVARGTNAAHPRDVRERGRAGSGSSESRPAAGSDRRRAPAPRGTASNGNGGRSAAAPRSNGNGNGHAKPLTNGNGTHSNGSRSTNSRSSSATVRNGSFSNGNGNGNGSHSNGKAGSYTKNGSGAAKPFSNGNGGKNAANSHAKGASSARPSASNTARPGTRSATRPTGAGNAAGRAASNGSQTRNGANGSHKVARPNKSVASATTARPRNTTKPSKPAEREPSATKRYSFSGQAKQAPKAAAKPVSRSAARPATKPAARAASASKTVAGKSRGASSKAGSKPVAATKRRG